MILVSGCSAPICAERGDRRRDADDTFLRVDERAAAVAGR
jgi:hypothetical protein